jgi:anti-anti-sigma factor
MAKRKLTVEFEEVGETTGLYRLAGGLYGTSEAFAFQDEVRRKLEAGMRRVAVDLAGVDRIDSSGVGILAAIITSAQRRKAGLVLASLPSHVEQVLSIAWLLKCVEHAASTPEALAKLEAMQLPR